MLTVLNIPFFGAIPYCDFYGFANRWFLSGLALWLIAGAIGKTMKLPTYKAVSTLEAGDITKLRQERSKAERRQHASSNTELRGSSSCIRLVCQVDGDNCRVVGDFGGFN
jgi:hypothetical protein